MAERESEANDSAYSPVARQFHWWTAALVIVMLVLGNIMGDDGPIKFSETTQGQLMSLHKMIGFIILWLVVARLAYRFMHGAPPSEPSLDALQKGASHATHWLLYVLLLAVPLGGWIGVSMYGARDIFNLFSLPQIAPVNQKLSETVFGLHGWGADAILVLLGLHVAAALYHHFIRRDNVLRRMLPKR